MTCSTFLYLRSGNEVWIDLDEHIARAVESLVAGNRTAPDAKEILDDSGNVLRLQSSPLSTASKDRRFVVKLEEVVGVHIDRIKPAPTTARA